MEEVEEIQQEEEIVINPLFEPLFSDKLTDKRYYQVYGGRGSGKSFTVALAIALKTYSPFKHRILYLRQTMTSSEDSTIADIRMVIEKLMIGHDFEEKNGTITNKKTGSTITFKGVRSSGSQTAKLKSLSGVTTLVVEEAEEIESFEEFSKVDESIRIKGKPLKVILIYNPTSSVSSWIHQEWFEEGQPKEERKIDTEYIHSTYLDNLDNLNESTIAAYERYKITNPTYYINTILAEWTLETQGRIYDGWELYDIFENEGETWYGLDFGYGGKDHTSLVKVVYFEKKYFVKLVFSKPKMKIKEILEELQKNIYKHSRVYADSAMPLLIGEIRDGGFSGVVPCQKGNVESGIKRVQDKRIVIVGDTKSRLYIGYQSWRRDKNDKLLHEPDELAAMRYAINSHRPTETTATRTSVKVHKPRGFI
jgi:phage terminase large subunit